MIILRSFCIQLKDSNYFNNKLVRLNPMLDIVTNPLKDPIKKLLEDLKSTEWKFPYLLQTFHFLITLVLLLILFILYITVGVISQIANSFWNILTGMGERMSFSNPISSLFYAVSSLIYFLLFLPFFLLQSPFWISGWITSKIGFKPFIIIIIVFLISVGIYFFQPEFSHSVLAKVVSYHDSIKHEYFPPDSLNITVENNIESASLKK